MIYKLILTLKQPDNALVATPILGAIFAVIFALLAWAGKYLSPSLFPDIDSDTLNGMLTVIASSMLAVTTFSLSIMVSAFSSTANNASPRATELVMADDNTRLAIASFISAFVYAIIAKTALSIGAYEQNGRFILFVSTAFIFIYLVHILISWVRTLSRLGRLDNTLEKIETATQKALQNHANNPYMGAVPEPIKIPAGTTVRATVTAYLTHIDMASLNKITQDYQLKIHIRIRPGKLVFPESLLAIFEPLEPLEEKDKEKITQAVSDCFVFSHNRSFDQDPSYGLIVLSEVAQRALSSAINDPGTAIHTLSITVRLILLLCQNNRLPEKSSSNKKDEDEPLYPHLTLIHFDDNELIRDGFNAICRDGAGVIEVGLRIQKALAIISESANTNHALYHASCHQASVALNYAKNALHVEEEFTELALLHTKLFPDSPSNVQTIKLN